MRRCESLLEVFLAVAECETKRLGTEKLKPLGGKVEQGVMFVDLVEETDFWLALGPTPASAG